MFVIFIKKKNEIFILIHYPQQAHLSKINVISKKVTAKPHILKKKKNIYNLDKKSLIFCSIPEIFKLYLHLYVSQPAIRQGE